MLLAPKECFYRTNDDTNYGKSDRSILNPGSGRMDNLDAGLVEPTRARVLLLSANCIRGLTFAGKLDRRG